MTKMAKTVTVQLNTYFNSSKETIAEMDATILQQMKNYIRNQGLPGAINIIKPIEYDGSGQLMYKVVYYDQSELIRSMLADVAMVRSVRLS